MTWRTSLRLFRFLLDLSVHFVEDHDEFLNFLGGLTGKL